MKTGYIQIFISLLLILIRLFRKARDTNNQNSSQKLYAGRHQVWGLILKAQPVVTWNCSDRSVVAYTGSLFSERLQEQ